ncbi:MAG: 23S rRNA (pseudouridine(1915)-N(3))-methyltransferase RlmH [Oscillospiraceae bacterium]|nr:23S rRNA (pseudouridine(1915)-N(3))-methyltransferase RlmH [Oscillospiraceae bacterium]MDD3832459.1 23S rRNA (pseudouridine(1915)-N(3))-methyltransferase RlmH [Oscillospiraceae bacterium]
MRSMMVACVGKLKEEWLRDACAEYAKRLGGFCRLTVIEVEEERIPDKPSAAQIEAGLKAEGVRLISKAGSGSYRCALCIEGKGMSSTQLADHLDNLAVNGQGDVIFFIGGSWGLSPEVKAAADLCLSMSVMTFPHRLARVMLLEQLYRTRQISSGGKYHK